MRRKFLDRAHDRKRLRRLGKLVLERQAADVARAGAEAELEKRKQSTVYLNIERSFREPAAALRIMIYPQDFRYAFYRRSGSEFGDASYYAQMIGREVEEKVVGLLLNFIRDPNSIQVTP